MVAVDTCFLVHLAHLEKATWSHLSDNMKAKKDFR